MQSKECRVKRKWHSMSKNNRILTIVVCIFLAIVLFAGSGFGVYFAVLEANTAVKLDNVRMDEGVLRVFASYYKDRHISDLRADGYYNARDTEEFWESLHENQKTQGELYIASLNSYLSGILAASNIYLSSNKLTDSDRACIKEKTQSFISYYGSVENFNEKAKEYGFDYDDFCRAMELSYIANTAFYSIYGSEGESLKSDIFFERCEEQLKSYARVKLIFIAKGEIFDSEIKEWRELNAAETKERNDRIEEFMSAVAEGQMLDVTFDAYLGNSESLHDGDSELGKTGYYFKRGAVETDNFEYKEIVNAALEMEIGEVRAVECGNEERGGVAFICRTETVSGAYTNDDNPFFSDFYKLAAITFYAEDIEVLSSEAEYKDLYYEINPISIPANKEIFVTSWK